MSGMSTAKKQASDRRESYLDAAERAFFRLGYEGASMRTIANEARVGLGTITYHWDTKEALLNEVFERRLGAILKQQEQNLLACEATLRAGEHIALIDIVRALIQPIFVTPFEDREAIDRAHHLFSFLMTEPSATVLAFNNSAFKHAGEIFYALLKKLGRSDDPETLHWLFACAVGAHIVPLSLAQRNTHITGQPKSEPDWEHVCEIVVGFIVRGFGNAA